MNTLQTATSLAAPLLFIPLLAFAQARPVAPQPQTMDGAETHVYKSTSQGELRLHVFSPATRTKSPAIVFFFGGGWTSGSVHQFTRQAKHFAQRGMVAIIADYRVFGRHRTSAFEAMADAKSAIRWVRAHAAKLQIDPKRIVAAGGSAGGHIALSSALLEAYNEPGEDKNISSKPNALVLFNPVVDTSADTPMFKERFGDRRRDGSPYHHLIAGLPPMIILHGKADTVVPYASVELFCTESHRLGNQCELVGYEGAKHGFFNSDNAERKWQTESLLEADHFLSRIGYLPATTASLTRP